ncbi:MAG: hypothetical protein Q9186_002549 [Xanthomendoza sp. 1 TL-2023]
MKANNLVRKDSQLPLATLANSQVGHLRVQGVEDLCPVEGTGADSVVDSPEVLGQSLVQRLVTSAVDQIITLETAKLRQ